MKTSTLIHLLATNPEPFDRHALVKSVAWPLVIGLAVSTLLSVAFIGILSAQDFLLPPVWIKFLYGLALVVSLGALLVRLTRPGVPLNGMAKWPLLVMLAMAAIGLVYLMVTPQAQKASVIFGQTWLACPWFVLGLSMPALAGFLFTAKRMAPTDLKTAGFVAGLLAGAVGALGYSFACPETSLTFVAIWYTAGIVLSGLVGRVLGPVMLRW